MLSLLYEINTFIFFIELKRVFLLKLPLTVRVKWFIMNITSIRSGFDASAQVITRAVGAPSRAVAIALLAGAVGIGILFCCRPQDKTTLTRSGVVATALLVGVIGMGILLSCRSQDKITSDLSGSKSFSDLNIQASEVPHLENLGSSKEVVKKLSLNIQKNEVFHPENLRPSKEAVQKLSQNEQREWYLIRALCVPTKNNHQVVQNALNDSEHWAQNYINTSKSSYKLTPLGVATMVNDIVMAKLLIEKGADVAPKDHRDWTPLHYAYANGNQGMIALLNKYGHPEDVITKAGATPKDLQERLAITPVANNQVVFRYKDGEKVVEGTAEKFRELTGANFINKTITEPGALWKEWLDQTSVSAAEAGLLVVKDKKYQDYKKNPPNLYIAQSGEAGLEVRAGELIEKGRIIVDYKGLRVSETPQNVAYFESENGIDGRENRNLGPLANDGFPNALMQEVYDKDGIRKHSVLIALEDIPNGEEICWDYGSSAPLCKEWHSELRMDALKTWLKQNRKKLSQAPSKKRDFNALAFLSKVQYLYNTPKTALRLLLNGDLSTDLFTKMLRNYPIIKAGERALVAILQFTQTLDQHKNQRLAKEIKTFCTQVLEENKYGFSAVASWMTALLQTGGVKEANWKTHAISLLDAYNNWALVKRDWKFTVANFEKIKEGFTGLDRGIYLGQIVGITTFFEMQQTEEGRTDLPPGTMDNFKQVFREELTLLREHNLLSS